jgi:hypothetical protein
MSMSGRLTGWVTGSTESLSSDAIDERDPLDGADRFEKSEKSDRSDFFQGVRRKFSISHSSRGRLPSISTLDDAPAPRKQSVTRQVPSSAPAFRDRFGENERSLSRQNDREKPLPKTPKSPPLEELLENPFDTYLTAPDTPKPFNFTSSSMSRPPPNGSRTSTMDSNTPAPPQGLYSSGYKSQSSAYLSDMSNSQSGLQQDKEADDDTKDILTPRSNGPPSAGPSPAMTQPRSAGPTTMNTPSTNASTHLSGLMCNVHRTTGREPPALVGATTTILGDKLFVFGGRILSRTKPQLTADLFELDLIRRHWTKLETSGDIPPPRYFHSVCPLGDTKLVCYGGMSPANTNSQTLQGSQAGLEAQPEVVVMSDIYIYDAPTRTWSFIETKDTPEGRYAHCATILPSSATFSSANAPMSAIQHNPPSSNPNQGSIGVNIDGTGGAEMVVVGGQDSANHYIEQISVFNLRSLKWTSTQQLGKSCGAYRSVVAPLPSAVSARIGKGPPPKTEGSGMSQEAKEPGSSMLIYSNYNFLDVKLELQIRAPDGTLSEKPMHGTFSPPGLRFPNGGVIDTNFVVSGTYLTSSKQEYALWALDLRTLTWSRIDAGGSIFSQGSWNRGVLWNRRNTFVILGNRKRSLVEDYNHRRINFSNVCMVELEAFGLYDNPRRVSPMSGFVSASSYLNSPSLSLSMKAGWSGGGRPHSKAAEELGVTAMSLRELADMDLLSVGGERIPVNSRIIARRWGPYFVQLLREGAVTQDGNDAATLRPSGASVFSNAPSRNSAITITPSVGPGSSGMSTLAGSTMTGSSSTLSVGQSSTTTASFLSPPDSHTLPPSTRPRTLYLPHTHLTLQSLVYYLYTSTLPSLSSPLSSPQILCSLLQIARPYRIDGLVEAVVERLHQVLDSRNAAAVFNAGAMAAGGGRAVMGSSAFGPISTDAETGSEASLAARTQGLRINTSVTGFSSGMRSRSNTGGLTMLDDSDEIASTTSTATSESEFSRGSEGGRVEREIWAGDLSAVIGLQKRGLRGLMEGRRARERGGSLAGGQRVGLGIA